jgi:hypothetical protein
MYTGGDIYNRLTTGATGAKRSGPFADPTAGPAAGGHTLNEIMAVAPSADNTNGAAVSDVLAGKTFWGLRTDGTWGHKTGTVAAGTNVTGTNGYLVINLPGGLYSNWHRIGSIWSGGQTATAVDTNLVAANIKSGTTIFGVSGAHAVVDTSSGTAAAGDLAQGKTAYINGNLVTGTFVPVLAKRVNKTGQTQCWDSDGNSENCTGTGQDGEYQCGIDPAIEPTGGTTGAYNTPALVSGTRFTDNGDGTVTDNLTALIWLKNANCSDTVGDITGGALTWANALIWSNYLASGACGLTDNSKARNWRLPNINELHSLGPTWPPGTPFTGIQSDFYWSSSTYANVGFTFVARVVGMNDGVIGLNDKPNTSYVWPVRGGQ